MRWEDDPESALVATVAEDLGDGWQVVWTFAVQASQDVVIAGMTIRPENWRASGGAYRYGRGVAPGGITARQIRSLRPGAAVRRFVETARSDPARYAPVVTTEDALTVLSRVFGVGAAEKVADMMDQHYLDWLEALKTFSVLQPHAVPAERRRRIAHTAALYVQALAEGHRAPRKRVAELEGRDEAAVRDDLYAARHESPELLTAIGKRGEAGGALTDAARALLEPEAPPDASSSL